MNGTAFIDDCVEIDVADMCHPKSRAALILLTSCLSSIGGKGNLSW